MTAVGAMEIDDGGDELALSQEPNEILSESFVVAESDSNSSAYLVLDNDADRENIEIGEEVVWEVSVINLGNDIAKNVKVYDQLPDGLEYVSHTTTKGTFNPDTGIWLIGDLAVSDGEVFLHITTKAVAVGEMINKAYLTTDSLNLNNETYEEEEIDVEDNDDDDKDVSKSIASAKMVPAGNPLALILLSVFGVFTASFKKFKR